MSATRYCACPAPSIVVNRENVRYCDDCGEQEDPLVLRLVQALAQVMPGLLELRDRLAALDTPEAGRDEWVELGEMAQRLHKSRDWMYRHARELGGRQYKPRGRWLFCPEVVMARLGASEGDAPPRPASPPRPLPSKVPLLPVKDRAA